MDTIIKYLTDVRGIVADKAAKIVLPMQRHIDIVTELAAWVETRTYPSESPLCIEGYTAEDIAKMASFMDGVGVYNFMVTLRERPEKAKKIIADGFPRK